MYILITATCLIILLTIVWLRNYFKYGEHVHWINGPRPLPFLGNILEFISGDALCDIYRLQQRYGGIVKTKFPFFPPVIHLTDPTWIQYILRSKHVLNKSNDYRFSHPWLGHGLLTAPGERWKKQRKLITPAFNFEKLQCYIETIEKYSTVLVEKLSNVVGEETVDIYPFINLCSLDIICEATMGSEINAQLNSKSDYVTSVKEMCRIIIDRSMSFIKSFDFLYQFSKDYRIQRSALKILHGYSRNVIELRQKALSRNKNTLLDLLLDSNELSDEEIREEVDTFMFAGHDTVTSAISFLLYCLAKYPIVQERVIEEMNTTLWLNSSKTTYGDLQELKYLDAVIKETLRLYPSVPIYCRHVDEDFHMGDKVIPANTNIAIFSYGVHRCAKTYPNPEHFDPNRFLTDNQGKGSIASYIPFSVGYRNCIGQKFAMLEMKIVITKILKRYSLLPTTPEHKLKLRAETVLTSKNGVCIKLAERFS